jgi:hypothetical protein
MRLLKRVQELRLGMRSFCILKTELVRNPRFAAMLKLKPAGIIDKALLVVCHVLEI